MPQKKTVHRSPHLLVQFVSIVATLVIGISVGGLIAYLSADTYRQNITAQIVMQNRTISRPKPTAKTPPPLALQTTPVVVQEKPDSYFSPIEDGMVPVITNIPTQQPVVFLTIDDGAHKSPDELPALTNNHLHATLFLARLFISDNPLFFDDFQKAGNPIENHSLNHLTDYDDIHSYAVQHAQICGMADYEQQVYGRRPEYFRPPGGSYSNAMRRAAADCGMKAIVTWIAKANGGSMQYQIGDKLRAGDIVLMHFRPEFQQDLQAFLDAMNAQKLHTELLEDWLR
jgi:peptidoglycan/xylan/chitin deacetylase (PgdA/CDA1 family)